MASQTNNTFDNGNILAKNERTRMNKLRDCGMEYISTSGRLIPAKMQPGVYCHCPQQCQKKLPKEKWKQLFREFYNLADQNKQNLFLQTHIVIKTVHLHNWETKEKIIPANKRRVTCKYHVPNLSEEQKADQFLDRMSEDTVEVCQKAFMNVFGITEKRVRMQRERCIALLAPNYYRKSHLERKTNTDLLSEDLPAFNDAKPMNLSVEHVEDETEPLDLSNHSEKSASPIEIDKTKLYELADMLGVPRSTVDREMLQKYEKLVRKNIDKQRREMLKNNKKKPVQVIGNLRGISEQVVGLDDNLTILPMQTLNNGDLTITPLLGPSPVHNQDIMQVNSFFQNQLWRPEYIGLTGKNDPNQPCN